MSTFDAKNLLEVAFTQSNDTKLIPTPEGEYMAVIEAIDIKSGVSQKNNEPWLTPNSRATSPTLRPSSTTRRTASTLRAAE